MAEAVSIVVTDDGAPPPGMPDLKLHAVLDNSFATPPVRAAKTNFVGDKIDKPPSLLDIRVRHVKPRRSAHPTATALPSILTPPAGRCNHGGP